MKDHVTIAIKNNIRIYVATTTNTVLEATKRHNLWPVATSSLCRLLSVTSIMGKMLKDKQKIVSILNGGGPLGTLMAESDSHGNIRGYVANPNVDLKYNSTGNLAVEKAVGEKGTLKVIKDLGLKRPFRAEVAMIDGTITNEFTHYFYQSEQTRSAIMQTCLLDKEKGVVSSGAILFQLLPGYSEEDIKEIEKIISKTKNFSQIFSIKNHQEILDQLIPGSKVIDVSDIRFNCSCDINKMKGAIIALDKKDKEEILNDGKCEIKCQYCSSIKVFNKEELTQLFSEEK